MVMSFVGMVNKGDGFFFIIRNKGSNELTDKVATTNKKNEY
jgi:hypothetical protein